MAFNSSFSSTQTEGAIAKIIQAIALPDSILSITSEASSSELNAALGGANGFNDLIEKIQSGAINQGIITTSDGHLASIPVSIHTDVAKTKINIFIQYNGVQKEITITNTDGTLSAVVQNKTYFKNGDAISGIMDNEDGTSGFYNGELCVSSGENSFASGFNTVSSGKGSFSSGRYLNNIYLSGDVNATTYNVLGIFDKGDFTYKGALMKGKVIFSQSLEPLAKIVSVQDQEGSVSITLDKTLNAESALTGDEVFALSIVSATGNGSHAENSLSSGAYSHAEGYSTQSTGRGSHSEGEKTIASNYNAHAEGWYSKASGDTSHSEGNRTEATGNNSHAEGQISLASGLTSHAEGYRTVASGNDSHAEGYGSIASGYGSHSEGGIIPFLQFLFTGTGGSTTYTVKPGSQISGEVKNQFYEFLVPGKYLLVQGDSGYDTKCKILTSQYQDGVCTVTTDATISDSDITDLPVGTNLSTAKGTSSHSEGSSLASGHTSHSEGMICIASGDASHVEGYLNIASGNYSHAEGNQTQSSGNSSHSEGIGTVARNDAEHAEGLYNKSVESEDASIATIHTVGIGSSLSDRKNAREIKKNGDTYIIGIGGYDGTNADEETTKSLQSVLSSSQQSLSVVDLQYSFDTLYSNMNTYESEIISIAQKVNENNNVIFKYVDTTANVTHFYYPVRISGQYDASEVPYCVYFNESVNVYTNPGAETKIVNFTLVTVNHNLEKLAVIYRHEITPYLVVSESEYSAIGEGVNTDGILYFVTPDN